MAAFWPIGTAQIIRIVSYPIRKKSRFWLFCMWSVKEMYHALLPKTDYRHKGRGHEATSFRFSRLRKFSKISNLAAQAWWKMTAKGAVSSPEKRDLRYCWRSLHLLWLLHSSWTCIVSNPFINVLSVCLVPLAGITEENSTVQRDIVNYSNICRHVHHL